MTIPSRALLVLLSVALAAESSAQFAFSTGSGLPTGPRPIGVTGVDYDKDGDEDVVVANYSGRALSTRECE